MKILLNLTLHILKAVSQKLKIIIFNDIRHRFPPNQKKSKKYHLGFIYKSEVSGRLIFTQVQ